MKAIDCKKLALPSQDSNLGSVFIKFIHTETAEGVKQIFVGIGEDEWVLKHGIEVSDIEGFLNLK